jgi:ribosomal protein S18 acetylase RimI-like enzyme
MTSIKHATINELDAITQLFEQYRLFYKKQADLQKATAFIKARLDNKDSVILFAELDKQAVGFVQLYPAFSSTAMQKMWILNDLFVSPDFRQLKVGKSLMNAATAYAIDTHAHSLKLCTSVDNLQAQALYKQLGYNKITTFYHYTLML